MPAIDPIIGMNLSPSQTELVQSWGLGHSSHFAPDVNRADCGSPHNESKGSCSRTPLGPL